MIVLWLIPFSAFLMAARVLVSVLDGWLKLEQAFRRYAEVDLKSGCGRRDDRPPLR